MRIATASGDEPREVDACVRLSSPAPPERTSDVTPQNSGATQPRRDEMGLPHSLVDLWC